MDLSGGKAPEIPAVRFTDTKSINGRKLPRILYRECLKNHAASLGGHALDGCGEFMPISGEILATGISPEDLKCAACGCHRNFHRREIEGADSRGILCDCFVKNSRKRSPPPYYQASSFNSAPHMLLALSAGLPEGEQEVRERKLVERESNGNGKEEGGTRKRFRTKFTAEQKEKMYGFSDKLGWKMQKQDEGLIQEFCDEIGIRRSVLKVWMHNNKSTLGRKDPHLNGNASS
ncbi:zinc-finger homeodomain protein 2 [Amborella trichopoda]|uniref:ZF-HD dimerization-type domain-containing protein n=1 Tax=Amborella trichopoda TaxID=13333 RepID=W1NG61_AMBTC|nr:zinc-finger homeodomain protein 2 [Amborella trichopoda]ERM94478.1 hypothetical protein AMTR_s00010p00261450 [Amborella trichopoda]|eukprot:XP_006827241.1 zinc-finger homeodomain protein 2 [Amborella trichopoda]